MFFWLLQNDNEEASSDVNAWLSSDKDRHSAAYSTELFDLDVVYESNLNRLLGASARANEIGELIQSCDYVFSCITTRALPPKFANRILLLFLSKADRENLIGDLAEEYCEIELTHGSRFANFWYWKQALASVWPLIRKTVGWSLFAWLWNFIHRHI
jgi:hypothetical protein